MLEDNTLEYRLRNLKDSVVAISKYWLFYSNQKCIICFIFSCSCCNLTASFHELLDCNTLSHFLIIQWASKLIS